VIQNRNIVFKKGYGKADLKNRVDITPSTVFHAASLTKQFTAMSIMLLVNRNKIRLDDPVDKYITVPIASQKHMTIRQMLNHISGIRDQWVLVTLAGKHLYQDEITQADVSRLVAQMTSVDFEPRDKFLYSNTGFTLAGMIIHKVTGQSLGDFARDNIFRPLGMTNTVIISRHNQPVANLALGYTGEKPYQVWMPKLSVPGATNLYTTVEDLARWDRNFDDKIVGGEAALSEMKKPAKLADGTDAEFFKDDEGNIVKYGLGLEITRYRGREVIEHDGRDAGYRTHLIRFPTEGLAVACLCNLALPENNLPARMAREIAKIYLGEPPGPQPSPIVDPPEPPSNSPGRADLARFTGRYHSDEIRMTYRVVLQRDSSLAIRRPNYPDTPLVSASPDGGLFLVKSFGRPISEGTVLFTEVGGKITDFTLTGDRFKRHRIINFQFRKLPEQQ